jgi:2-amino-4-hydroxy-6-hydroxymethyldihydropteridine diphosphokinase
MRTAFLGLGSNLGDRWSHLRAALTGLDASAPVQVRACSPVYETEPHTTDPDEEQPAFLNAVVEAEVGCASERLLRIAQRIEREEGRAADRSRWAPRPLDIDLLVVGDRTCRTDDLTLPHPRLAERRFVLRPWADLAPNFAVPLPFDATVRELLEACPDTATIRRLEPPLRSTGTTDGDPADAPK